MQTLLNVLIKMRLMHRYYCDCNFKTNDRLKMRLMHRYYCDCNFKTNDRSKMLAHIRNHPTLLAINEAGKLA